MLSPTWLLSSQNFNLKLARKFILRLSIDLSRRRTPRSQPASAVKDYNQRAVDELAIAGSAA